MDRPDSRWQGHRSRDQVRADRPRVGAERPGFHSVVPASAPCWSADDPGSRWYVNGKHKDCAEVGIASIQRELPATAAPRRTSRRVTSGNSTRTRSARVTSCNSPSPRASTPTRVLELMDPLKDAEGLHPHVPRPAGAQRAWPRCPAPRTGSWRCCVTRRGDQRRARRGPGPRRRTVGRSIGLP
ncbi:tetrahydrofolate dehydrogenase/cyclohydrolase catalytic domain-containing protein [Streptomyces cirratus]